MLAETVPIPSYDRIIQAGFQPGLCPWSKAGMNPVRASVLSGSWYSADAAHLAAEIDRYLAAADPSLRPDGRALLAVVPHAGYSYSGPSAGLAFGLLRNQRPRRVVILAPNHRTPLVRCAVSSATSFATPLGNVPLDTAACADLATRPGFVRADPAHAGEHAVEIQLPFLQRLWPDCPPPIVPVLVPRLDDRVRSEAADALGNLWDEETLVVVSSDFTHFGASYGYEPFMEDVPDALEKLDAGAILKILAGDAAGLVDYGRGTGITMCGLEACAMALTCGLPPGYEAALLDYRRSADLNGDFSRSVSYAAILICAGAGKETHG